MNADSPNLNPFMGWQGLPDLGPYFEAIEVPRTIPYPGPQDSAGRAVKSGEAPVSRLSDKDDAPSAADQEFWKDIPDLEVPIDLEPAYDRKEGPPKNRGGRRKLPGTAKRTARDRSRIPPYHVTVAPPLTFDDAIRACLAQMKDATSCGQFIYRIVQLGGSITPGGGWTRRQLVTRARRFRSIVPIRLKLLETRRAPAGQGGYVLNQALLTVLQREIADAESTNEKWVAVLSSLAGQRPPK